MKYERNFDQFADLVQTGEIQFRILYIKAMCISDRDSQAVNICFICNSCCFLRVCHINAIQFFTHLRGLSDRSDLTFYCYPNKASHFTYFLQCGDVLIKRKLGTIIHNTRKSTTDTANGIFIRCTMIQMDGDLYILVFSDCLYHCNHCLR